MSVTTAIILDKRRMNKKTKNYPVCIRVTFERKPRAFPTGIEMKAKEFEKLSSPRLGEKLREIKEKLEKVRYRVQLTTHLINEHMYAIAKELGISLLPGTNDARHAFATQLKRAGKDIEFVRELLGHLNVKTTQGYYDDFEDETKRGITEHLLPFKKKELSNETAAR